jgi:hypothetical protein
MMILNSLSRILDSLKPPIEQDFSMRLFRTSCFCVGIALEFDLQKYCLIGLLFVPFLFKLKL